MSRAGFIVCLVLLAVQGSRSVIWPCEESRECSDKVEKAQCSIFGFCQCPAGHVFSAGVTSCLPESAYGVACQEAVQCSHMLTGARCEAGVCTCDGDYTYVRGRCRKLVDLGQPCSEDIDCFFSHNREAVVCRDGTCDCADGFYRRSSNVCRRRVTNGELCLVHQDCDGGNLRCENQVCTTDGAAAQTKSFRDVAIQTVDSAVPSSEAHQEGPPSKVDTGTDMQPEKPDQPAITTSNNHNGHEGTGTTKRVQIVTKRSPKAACAKCRKFGDACVDEGVECPEVPYSVCRMGQCHCKDGYYHADGLCMAELGEYAHQESYCPAGTDYRNNRCTCPNNNFYDNNMRTCLKPAQGINTSCTQQSQCSPYGLAYCPADSPKRCTCHPYAEYDEAKQMCVEKQGFEAYCEKDADCALPNSRCTPQKTCVCQTNYFYVNERCMAASGSPCQTVADCAFEEAECTGEESESEGEPPSEPSNDSPKQCRCKRGYLYQSDSNKCLREAEQYEDECSVDEQCQPLLGELGQCIEAKCQCNEAVHHYKDGKCNTKIALDERCGKSSECFVEDGQDNVECRNSACQCKFDYSPDVEQQKCIRPSGKNSSDRPSALKVITLMLTSAAVLITGSALRDAYYA